MSTSLINIVFSSSVADAQRHSRQWQARQWQATVITNLYQHFSPPPQATPWPLSALRNQPTLVTLTTPTTPTLRLVLVAISKYKEP